MKPRMSERTDKKPALVLLSGGLDSATVLAMAIDQGFEPYCMSFRYGQGHAIELEASDRVAKAHGVKEHKIVEIDLRAFGGSALTDDIEVPKGRDADEMTDGIPVTYVPARNTIFLSYALAWAEVAGAFDIFIGVNAVDYSGYPDCRPEFIQAFETMANLATAAAVEGKGHFTVHAPLLNLTKAEIIVEGNRLGVDYGLTHSCYDPVGELACGQCDSCILRKQGFVDAEVSDPTQYA
jgi:7-cyano-7-deazaguanine synthase